ncbi:MAG: ABC transporter substrate-binding protein [Spirochaetes bacterium]|nr:ABC transporter substrate-binding protein [Spirochaetota bacterium]
MKKRFKQISLFFLVFIIIFSTLSCKKQEAEKGPITVASKIDTEGALLGQMIVELLKTHGFTVIDKTEFGPTDLVRKAVTSGEIDIYPEYTGNGGFFFDGTDPNVWKNSEAGYQLVKKLDLEKNNLVWLTPAPANNTWALAVREDLAQQNQLKTLEDLGKYISAGGNFKLACSEEFVQRPDALPAFQKAYGFTLTKDQLLTFSGGNTSLTEKAAAEQTDGVNSAMAYGTDGALSALHLVVLEDNKGVQPVYQPTPIVRKAVFDQYPEIEKILKPAFESLDLVTLQSLNSKIAIEGNDPKEVALSYLKSKQLIKD